VSLDHVSRTESLDIARSRSTRNRFFLAALLVFVGAVFIGSFMHLRTELSAAASPASNTPITLK
jgi:hypothetical protein